MTLISIYVDSETEARLRRCADELDRSVEELAGNAVAEAVLDYFRHRMDDPAKVEGARLHG